MKNILILVMGLLFGSVLITNAQDKPQESCTLGYVEMFKSMISDRDITIELQTRQIQSLTAQLKTQASTPSAPKDIK